MSLYVVDASVVIKWYIPEDLSDKADLFLHRSESAGDTLIAPEFLLIEVSNILWKKRRRKEVPDPDVRSILDQLFKHLGVRLIGCSLLTGTAVDIALDTDRSVYDALYLAAAELYEGTLITADEKLVNSLSSHPLASRIAFIGSF